MSETENTENEKPEEAVDPDGQSRGKELDMTEPIKTGRLDYPREGFTVFWDEHGIRSAPTARIHARGYRARIAATDASTNDRRTARSTSSRRLR